MGSSSLSYKFNSPVDCQQLPAVLDETGKVKSIFNNFVSDSIKNQLLEMVKDDTRFVLSAKLFLPKVGGYKVSGRFCVRPYNHPPLYINNEFSVLQEMIE